MIFPESTLAEIVVAEPAAARVFEQLGLDYCCGGGHTVREACSSRGLDVERVIAAVRASGGGGGACEVAGLSPAELCEHVVTTHHDYLRSELPRLSALLEKVDRAHGAEDATLGEVRRVFGELRSELEQHTADEEERLFPALARGEAVDTAAFVDDHAGAGLALERLSALTGGYDTSEARCNTHRASLHALAELQADLHRHIHEENNILFKAS